MTVTQLAKILEVSETTARRVLKGERDATVLDVVHVALNLDMPISAVLRSAKRCFNDILGVNTDGLGDRV